jgi:hypothetical protein
MLISSVMVLHLVFDKAFRNTQVDSGFFSMFQPQERFAKMKSYV